MDGWIDRQIDGYNIDRWIQYRQMERQIDIDRQINGQIGRQIDRLDRYMVRYIDGQIDKYIDGQIDKYIDGQKYRKIDKKIDKGEPNLCNILVIGALKPFLDRN